MNNWARFIVAAGSGKFGKKFLLSFMAIQMICCVITISSLSSQSKNVNLSHQKTAILLIPHELLSCGFCLDTLDAIIDSLNNYSHQVLIWGVITPPDNHKTFSDSMISIYMKQIHGLIIGRSIKFPVFFDSNSVLNPSSNPALIVFSSGNSPYLFDLSTGKNPKYSTLLQP